MKVIKTGTKLSSLRVTINITNFKKISFKHPSVKFLFKAAFRLFPLKVNLPRLNQASDSSYLQVQTVNQILSKLFENL